MANGYYERGEVYWIGKQGSAQLGVVVSSNKDNKENEYIAVAVICGEEPYRGVATLATGRRSYVSCANLRTVSKKEIRTFVGTLTQDEVKQMDNHLEEFFDLGYEDEEKDKELTSLRSKVARLESQVASLNEGIMARSIDMNNWKKKYDKAVDRIVDLELDADVSRRIAERQEIIAPETVELEPEQKNNNTSEVEIVREVVNINTASAKEISEKLAMPLNDAYAITGYRNKNGLFVCVEELLEVSRISRAKYEIYRPWIVIDILEEQPEQEPEAVEVSESDEKININTANIHELMAVGFGKPESGRIVAYIKRNGPFKNLDDLTNIDGVTGKVLRKLRDKLEV